MTLRVWLDDKRGNPRLFIAWDERGVIQEISPRGCLVERNTVPAAATQLLGHMRDDEDFG